MPQEDSAGPGSCTSDTQASKGIVLCHNPRAPFPKHLLVSPRALGLQTAHQAPVVCPRAPASLQPLTSQSGSSSSTCPSLGWVTWSLFHQLPQDQSYQQQDLEYYISELFNVGTGGLTCLLRT